MKRLRTGLILGIALLSALLLFGAALHFIFDWPVMIHDISTDLENPPQFEALLEMRKGASNPPEHPGESVARIQRRKYPDIQPLLMQAPREQVFANALAVAKAMGWRIVSTDADRGRIEAVATTRLLRFKDDIVVRLSQPVEGVRVDVRSKSRIGRSDLGANARRIRDFLGLLRARGSGG